MLSKMQFFCVCKNIFDLWLVEYSDVEPRKMDTRGQPCKETQFHELIYAIAVAKKYLPCYWKLHLVAARWKEEKVVC